MEKNTKEEIEKTITGHNQVQEQIANIWGNIFAAEGITTTREDIENYLGADVSNRTKKVTEGERAEMDEEIGLEDIAKVISSLKPNKAPGTMRNSTRT